MSVGKSPKTNHYVYLLCCADDSLYCGYATDVARRVREHNGQEKVKGAKYTASRRPVAVVYQEAFSTRSAAMQREAKLKRLTRAQKLQLIKNSAQGSTDT